MPTLTMYVPAGFTVTPVVGDPPDVAALNTSIKDLTTKLAAMTTERDARATQLAGMTAERDALKAKIAKAAADLSG